jgi:hypothetical protein
LQTIHNANPMKTLAEIASTVTAMAHNIGADRAALPAFGSAASDGSPFIEVDAQQYHFVVEERGEEVVRQSSSDFNELLYWIFESVTHNLAFAHELAHRVDHQDSRRMGFAKQLALLGRINAGMATRRAKEIADILAVAPYVDA